MHKYLLAILFACINFLFLFNLDTEKVYFTERKIECISWNPYRYLTREPKYKEEIPKDIITKDLDIISTYSSCVRVYFSTANIETAIKYGKTKGIKFILGAYLSKDKKRSIQEVRRATYLSRKYKNIIALIIGNENTSKFAMETYEGITVKQLVRYLKYAKSRTKTPISTAELPNTWVQNRGMQRYVDFVSVNFLPYWYHKPASFGTEWLINKYQSIKKYFPDKVIFVAEAGWPTHGVRNSYAIPGVAEQKQFLRDMQGRVFFSESKEYLGVGYNFFEAFDQPWKSSLTEGRVGAHWGLARASGETKYNEEKEDENFWGSPIAWVTSFLGLFFSIIILRLKKYNYFTSVFWLFLNIQITVSCLFLVVRSAHINYLLLDFYGVMLIPFILVPLFIALFFTFECCDALQWNMNKKVKKTFSDLTNYPFVSIHIPFCNEQTELVIESIKSVLALDYPQFEIIALSNNTKNVDSWSDVKLFCEKFPKKIKFFHIEKISGFKAGALNFCLEQTNAQAEYVAVLDSDYIVDKNWLKESLQIFSSEEKIAAVQHPQSYRFSKNSSFEKSMHGEYDSFFKVGMNLRSRENAAIMHGTMLVVKHEILKKLKWAQWSICEDAELGLRLVSEGHKVFYSDKILGKGVLPASYKSYVSQRFRWAYGGLRILFSHYKKFIGTEGNLTWQQRYYYLFGWAPWIAESIFLFFCSFGFLIAIRMLKLEQAVPESASLFPMLVLFISRFISVIYIYSKVINFNLKNIILSFISGISLTYPISLAAFLSVMYPNISFVRTDKGKKEKNNETTQKSFILKIVNIILSVYTQLFISMVFVSLSYFIWRKYGFKDMDRNIWLLSFIILSLPGYAALLMTCFEKRHSYLKNSDLS